MKNFLRFPLCSFVLVCAIALGATPLVATFGPIEPAAAQITPIDEEPDDAPGLGSIVGSPEAGPKPEDPGDRGGYAQLGLALVLLGGVAFIASRIVLDAKRSSSRSSQTATSIAPSESTSDSPSTTPSDTHPL